MRLTPSPLLRKLAHAGSLTIQRSDNEQLTWLAKYPGTSKGIKLWWFINLAGEIWYDISLYRREKTKNWNFVSSSAMNIWAALRFSPLEHPTHLNLKKNSLRILNEDHGAVHAIMKLCCEEKHASCLCEHQSNYVTRGRRKTFQSNDPVPGMWFDAGRALGLA